MFSERHRFELWRTIWVALAEAQHEAGLVAKEELADLRKHQSDINVERIEEIEADTRHDVVAAIREYAEKAKVGGGKIHLGATSYDIVDNADTMRFKEGLGLLDTKLSKLLEAFAKKIDTYANLTCMGFTHLQPAEPTTVGYRLAFYAQELLIAWKEIHGLLENIQAKGLKGAVGTAASYETLLKETKLTPQQLEETVMNKLGLNPATVTSQVAPRSTDYILLVNLNLVAGALAKFAADVRVLQSAPIGEWSEPFGKSQVGSSAMPFKRNPVSSEKICSLARIVNQLPAVAMENAAHSYLERTLDDSANRRVVIPEAFLAVDEIVLTSQKVLDGLTIHEERITHNLSKYGVFAATEGILMEAVKAGADRQAMHETLRTVSLQAWQKVQAGEDNPLAGLLEHSPEITKFVSAARVRGLLDVSHHIGDAPARAKKLSKQVRAELRAG